MSTAKRGVHTERAPHVKVLFCPCPEEFWIMELLYKPLLVCKKELSDETAASFLAYIIKIIIGMTYGIVKYHADASMLFYGS
jgi:hypothetical protein